MGSCLCDKCAALCCRYFALPIETPETRRQYDDIRWYLVHENCVVFIEKKTWYLAVMAKCKHLQPDNRCGIYETRPRICRSYSTDNCDYHGGEYEYDELFTSAEQLWEYAQKQLKLAREKRRRQREREAAGRAGKAVRKPARRTTSKSRPLKPTLIPATALQRPAMNGSTHAKGVPLPVLGR